MGRLMPRAVQRLALNPTLELFLEPRASNSWFYVLSSIAQCHRASAHLWRLLENRCKNNCQGFTSIQITKTIGPVGRQGGKRENRKSGMRGLSNPGLGTPGLFLTYWTPSLWAPESEGEIPPDSKPGFLLALPEPLRLIWKLRRAWPTDAACGWIQRALEGSKGKRIKQRKW